MKYILIHPLDICSLRNSTAIDVGFYGSLAWAHETVCVCISVMNDSMLQWLKCCQTMHTCMHLHSVCTLCSSAPVGLTVCLESRPTSTNQAAAIYRYSILPGITHIQHNRWSKYGAAKPCQHGCIPRCWPDYNLHACRGPFHGSNLAHCGSHAATMALGHHQL